MRTPRDGTASKPGKRQRLVSAAVTVMHELGVEKTTIAQVAQAADVPVGNVYYYFKTKDDIIAAVIDAHAQGLAALTDSLDRLGTPQERLKALIGGWVAQRDLAARYGCPFGTLSCELDKRDDGLDRTAAAVMRLLIDWAERQFQAMGHDDAGDLAISLMSAYQGMSLLTNTFRDPDIMTRQGDRLRQWIDSLT